MALEWNGWSLTKEVPLSSLIQDQRDHVDSIRSVRLSSIPWSKEEVELLFDFLCECKNLEELSVSRCGEELPGDSYYCYVKPMFKFMKSAHSLKSLSFFWQHLTEEQVTELIEHLVTFTGLQKLVLDYAINATAATLLKAFFLEAHQLRHVALSGWTDGDILATLINALRDARCGSHLEQLDLNRSGGISVVIDAICQLLEERNPPVSLNLAYCCFSLEALVKLAGVFPKVTRLMFLNLEGHVLNSETARILAKELDNSPSVISIDLNEDWHCNTQSGVSPSLSRQVIRGIDGVCMNGLRRAACFQAVSLCLMARRFCQSDLSLLPRPIVVLVSRHLWATRNDALWSCEGGGSCSYEPWGGWYDPAVL